MSQIEITCPSCGMILEFKHDGMRKCKYCGEKVYIVREEGRILVRDLSKKNERPEEARDQVYSKDDVYGEQKIEYIDDDSGYYDDLEEGEKKIPPELLNRPKEREKTGPLKLIVFLLSISFVLFQVFSALQERFRPEINHDALKEQRSQSSIAKKRIAQEVSSSHMITFVEAMFGKEIGKITQEDYERVQYLKVVMPEFDSPIFYIDYALDELDFMDDHEIIDKEKLRISQKIKRIGLTIEGEDAFFLPIYDFQAFPNLKVLDLKDSHIMVDASGEHEKYEYHLKNLKKLKVFSLPQSERLESIENFLTDLEQLTSLSGDLYNVERFASILYRFENLQELRILRFDDSQAQELSFLSELEHLRVLELRMFDDNAHLLGLKGLKELILDAGSKERNYEVLQELKELESLEIKNAGTLKRIDFLEGLPNLKSLRITNSEILNLDVLKKLPLEELSLEKNLELKDFSAIAQLKSLKALHISTWWADHNAKMFKLEDLPNLVSLEVPNRWISKLGKSQTIEYLSLSANAGDDFYLESIPKMAQLKTLEFTNEAYLFNADALKKFDALQEVKFYKSRLQYFDLAELFNLQSVQKISFFGVESFAVDLNELNNNQTLKSLSMGSTDLLYLINHSNNNVDQKPHKFTDHPELFTKLQGLEELSLFGSGIKDLKFSQKLPNLKYLIVDEKVQIKN